ncbi:RdgB/HAM1 family non-canonical purine NTP pyrophosphatase [Patescibacteria group bacterium]|nr:RdgB/HAM1 family non-canonical purine NTP pyrophosphatase [Patescibacteria group bacterium]
MLFITGNKNKLKEFQEILGFKIESRDLDIQEMQEVDVLKVSADKAKKAFQILKRPVITEDTGLFFDELNGLPGALIKWFEKRLSYQEICDMIRKDRNATARVCISYYDGNNLEQFTGEVRGQISKTPKGENGFGWASIFIPKGGSKTFAEMNKNEKYSISMRKIALNKFYARFFKKHN